MNALNKISFINKIVTFDILNHITVIYNPKIEDEIFMTGSTPSNNIRTLDKLFHE